MILNKIQSKAIQKKLSEIPQSSGIYKFLDENGKILYVGKAQNLKNRVKSYFQNPPQDRPWILQMLPIIKDIEVIETEGEVEALILEANLIKAYKPKYNISLKDNKRYPWIVITKEKYPRIKKVRDTKLKGRYFGPYPNDQAVNHILRYLRKIYPYANCNLKFYPERKAEDVKKTRLCLYYHIGLCPGPCDNLINPHKYKENIDNIIKTLKGKRKSHIKKLEKEMYNLSEEKRFEDAAELRDKIQELRYLSQRIDVEFGDTEEDYLKIRESRLIAGLSQINKMLKLNIPREKLKSFRTECYDISNISGQIAYGSMVVANGIDLKSSEYRIFKIRDESAKDDTAMMKNVMNRRLKYLKTEKRQNKSTKNESLLKKPNLILLDGGKTQLATIHKLIKELNNPNLNNIGLIGISKGKHLKRTGKKQVDEFWTINNNKITKINISNTFIFEQLRDEAHRFAIKHHRQGRKFLQKKSILDEIQGVGPKRKKQLIAKFKSPKLIGDASVAEINTIIKNEKLSQKIKTTLEKHFSKS